MKIWIHLPVLLLLSGCTREPDMTPIGGGLAIVGLALIVSAVIQRLPHTRQKGDDYESR